MSLIRWKDDFRIGVAAVDYEHRELIELINALHDSMGAGADRERVLTGLGEIFAQISGHFALEERFMRDTAYAGFARHKEDHEVLLDELREIMETLESSGQFDEAGLARDLERWFGDHFRTQDALLHRQSPH